VAGPEWPDHFVTDISVDGRLALVRRNDVSSLYNRSTRVTRRLAISGATDLSGNGKVVHAVDLAAGGAPIREVVGTRTARRMSYAFPRRTDWSASSIDSDWTGRHVAIGANNASFGISSVFLVDTTARTRVDVGVRLGDVARRQFTAATISADGRYVAFASSIDFGSSSVHVYDRITNSFRTLASGDGSHQAPTLSADGTAVAFYSSASTLVPGTPPGTTRLYLHDFSTGRTSLVSALLSEDPFGGPVSLSADGDRVAHLAVAPVQLPGRPARQGDNVIVWENGVSRVVTVDTSGGVPNGRTPIVTMSDDGTAVAFASTATDLTGSRRSGVFVARLPGL
jgi:Tol biopolymer transport system component